MYRRTSRAENSSSASVYTTRRRNSAADTDNVLTPSKNQIKTQTKVYCSPDPRRESLRPRLHRVVRDGGADGVADPLREAVAERPGENRAEAVQGCIHLSILSDLD